MTRDRLLRPILLLGMPRSGTTILFESLARHSDLGWLTNYSRTHPRLPCVNVLRRLLDNRYIGLHGRKKQYGSVPIYNRWLPQPDEAYEFWDAHTGVPFSRSALVNHLCASAAREATRHAVARTLQWQGRNRFSAKLTGPPRIAFLRSVFPDAIFVHVVRDGRAVTHSLLNVPFWKNKGGLQRPFWEGLLEDSDIDLWRSSHEDAGVLAALQWRRTIERAHSEAASLPAEQYLQVRYEDFIADPHEVMRAVVRFCKLADEPGIHEYLERGPTLRNMNAKHARDFDADYLRLLTRCLSPALAELGYV